MTETTPSLYRRLGGYDVIAAIIDDMFALLRADPAFARLVAAIGGLDCFFHVSILVGRLTNFKIGHVNGVKKQRHAFPVMTLFLYAPSNGTISVSPLFPWAVQCGIGALCGAVQGFLGRFAVCPDGIELFVKNGTDGGNLRRTDFRRNGLALKLRIGSLQGVEVGLQQLARRRGTRHRRDRQEATGQGQPDLDFRAKNVIDEFGRAFDC